MMNSDEIWSLVAPILIEGGILKTEKGLKAYVNVYIALKDIEEKRGETNVKKAD